MTEETIINQVPQGPHFAAEGEKLKQEEAPTTDVALYRENAVSEWKPAVFTSPVAPAVLVDEPPEWKTPEHVEITEDDNIGNQADLGSLEDLKKAAESLLSNYGSSIQFDLFKKQVISAFRHLGLDVKKFFPDLT